MNVAAVEVSVIVISAIVVSAIVVTSIALMATTATAIILTAVVTTAAPVSAVAVTAVVTQLYCPATAIFNLEVHISAATVTVFTVIAAVHTGYSLSYSSHSGLHAAVAGRVANVAVVFCHCQSELSQFTHSEYNTLGCRIKDHSHSRVCM